MKGLWDRNAAGVRDRAEQQSGGVPPHGDPGDPPTRSPPPIQAGVVHHSLALASVYGAHFPDAREPRVTQVRREKEGSKIIQNLITRKIAFCWCRFVVLDHFYLFIRYFIRYCTCMNCRSF